MPCHTITPHNPPWTWLPHDPELPHPVHSLQPHVKGVNTTHHESVKELESVVKEEVDEVGSTIETTERDSYFSSKLSEVITSSPQHARAETCLIAGGSPKLVEQVERGNNFEQRNSASRNDETEQDPLSHEELLRLANAIRMLPGDDKVKIIEIVLKYHTIDVPDGDEELVSIPFDYLTTTTLREISACVASLVSSNSEAGPSDGTAPSSIAMEGTSTVEAYIGLRSRRARQRNCNPPKKPQATKRRGVCLVDVEARKRELVEGIKKLGGTGTTRPIKKQNTYTRQDNRIRSFYVRDTSSESSSSSSSYKSSESSSD